MQKVNKYHIVVISGIILLFMSCGEDFLTKDPPGSVFEGNTTNREGLESLLIGAYAELDGISGDSPVLIESAGSNWIYGDVYADNAYKGSDPIDQPLIRQMEQYNLNASNWYLYYKWIAVYDGISRCNDVIRITKLALNKGTIEQEEAIQFYAEARFLRAYFHLEAIKMWDFVPFVDENVSVESPYVENRPSGVDNLPEEPRNLYKGRAYKYPALCLMGKIKWFRGDHTTALEFFNEVLASDMFSLPENFHDNFRPEGDNNSESIFQCQASVNDNFNGWNGNMGDFTNYPVNIGFGFFQPSQNLVNAFKTTDGVIGGIIPGLPYLKTFNLDFNASGDDVKSDADPPLNSEDPFSPDTRPLDPRLDWSVGRRGIPFLDWGVHPGKDWIRDKNFYFGPYSPIKHLYYMSSAGEYADGWGFRNANNYSILRYADILLMAADCEVEIGSLDRARALVNEVRGRMVDHPEYWVKDEQDLNAANYVIARYPTGGISDPFQSKEGAKEAVQFERRLELALEGHRFWDLKKWGIAKSTLDAYAERESDKIIYLHNVEFDHKNVRFPIFQDVIERSDFTLKQIPGY
jgi:hypothetical protein